MDEQQQRISEDLAGLFEGELRFDPLSTAMYASDGSLYQLRPVAVACPLHRQDVLTLTRYAGERNIALVPRGAGTNITGSALGEGIIVDFSRHMREVEAIDESTVRVQPGVVHAELNRRLRSIGRYFAPDPANTETTTIGSMLAIDAAGSHAARVGSTRDHVQSIEVVLADGTTFEAGIEALPHRRLQTQHPPIAGASSTASGEYNDDAKLDIVSRLAKLLSDHASLIEERQPPLIRNCSGYHLRGVLGSEDLRLAQMLVGSEGTLGLFTSATLHTAPLPACRGVVLLLFGRIEAALDVAAAIADERPTACDLLDRRLLSLAREADARFERLIPPSAEAALVVEYAGDQDTAVRRRMARILRHVRAVVPGATVAAEAYSKEETDFLWSLPQRVVPLLTGLHGDARPLPFVEDVAVPPEALRDFVVRAQRVFQKHEVTATLYAHAASGQLHLRPFLPPPSPGGGQQIEAIARALYEAVVEAGGTMSGEHGDGLSRTAFLRSQYGPLYRVFQQVKDIFDPHNLLNPGKIVSDDPHTTIRGFRPQAGNGPALTDLQLQWSAQDHADAANLCNGCGTCRTQEKPERMCPLFRLDPSEDASPRSKANVMRNIAAGILPVEEMASDEMRKLTELCFNCKQCQLECPANVDIPHLMIEAKAGYVAANGLDRANWILSRAHSFGSLGCGMAPVMNRIINNRAARWLIEQSIGIARRRKLPSFARKPFVLATRRTHGDKRTGDERTDNPDATPVVYFVDHYANFHDPELGRALIAVLEHNDVPVHVPSGQTASGMAMISAGELDAARDLAEQNIRELAELAREGSPIICTEPAAALCFTQEYPLLLDHPDVNMVAEAVIEAGAYIGGLHQQGRLKTDFQPLELQVGYHTPCHLKALSPHTPFADLLSLIPGLVVHRIDEGCSGMAGAYGLTQAHFEQSIAIGRPLMQRMQEDRICVGVTECSSCKLQMEQETATPTIHPIKLLALAYGLMPELERKLKPNTKRLVVT